MIKYNGDCPNKSNANYSVWYLSQPYFYGKFIIIFELEESIIEPIFYTLLTFMDRYGFWSANSNIGYGRLKVEKVEIKRDNGFEKVREWRKEEFKFSNLSKDNNKIFVNKRFSNFIKSASNFSDLINKNDKILYKLENQIKNNDLFSIIKELIKIKSQERVKHNNKEMRHRLFGTVKFPPNKNELPQGTKIFPWIYEENNYLKGGFISIAGILNIK